MRVFLGNSSPLLPLLTGWLLENREALAETLVITPTSQSGRRLRESLAASATALLAPTVTTPGALLYLDDPAIAPGWLEKIAWIDTLGSISGSDWENYPNLFPIPPSPSDGSMDWAVSLADEITSLRTTLQECLHNLFSASRFLANSPEAGRWEDLSRLESGVEKLLSKWGCISRTTALRNGFKIPQGYKRIILAGITEMAPCLAEALEKQDREVICVIAAPESEMDWFTPLGLPTAEWSGRTSRLKAHVRIEAGSSQQASAAIDAIARSGADSSDIAIGSGDEHTGAELARQLSEKGWPAFHPAATQPLPSLVRWLLAWREWMVEPSSRNLASLLTLPESSALTGDSRAAVLLRLNSLRDRHPIADPKALAELCGARSPAESATITALLAERSRFLSSPFPEAILGHLSSLGVDAGNSGDAVDRIRAFLETAAPVIQEIGKSNHFWLQVLIAEIPTPPAHPSAGRVVDIQGWLELLYEPGQHLFICGMNDTFVPSRFGGEPWLSENIRKILGLNRDADRHARDAYLLHAMLEMRAAHGSAHLFCGKSGPGGEPYLPSRLLLQVPLAELAPAVANLFRELEPPESDLVWTRDFIWETPQSPPRERISVTALTDYLACPFRFYLKHVLLMSIPEPDRREMNARDFGSTTHFVLECWGADPDARQLSDPAKLESYFKSKLEEVISSDYGSNPPVAIRIQAEAIAQRLKWFSRQQALIRSEGWEVIGVERKLAIESNGIVISGKIDRIDRHQETGRLRVIDYKTGKAGDAEKAHRRKITASTRIPGHFEGQTAPFQTLAAAGGKSAEFFWRNLQLPLYALAESAGSGHDIPIPTYIHLGQTEDNVKLSTWADFSTADLESAKTCADWVTASVAARSFWPPTEKVEFDDYALLSRDAALASAFQPI